MGRNFIIFIAFSRSFSIFLNLLLCFWPRIWQPLIKCELKSKKYRGFRRFFDVWWRILESKLKARFSFFFKWVKWVLHSRNSLTTRPRYFTLLIFSICWPLILKLRCLAIFAWPDFGLNKIISALLAFKDILLALSQVFRSFRLWLMCLFTFFNDLSERIKLVSSAKWAKHHKQNCLCCRPPEFYLLYQWEHGWWTFSHKNHIAFWIEVSVFQESYKVSYVLIFWLAYLGSRLEKLDVSCCSLGYLLF